MSTLQEFKDNLAKQLFGRTVTEAVANGNCIRCNRSALEHCHSEAGKREFGISGLCEECFDEIFKE